MGKSKQQQWNEEHPNIVQKARAEYNKKRPVWAFRLTSKNIKWLEEERWSDDNGTPESDATLLNCKLDKLRKLEQQGFGITTNIVNSLSYFNYFYISNE